MTMDDFSGQVIRGYELRQHIGEVAIKVIRPEHANHPDFIRRFEVEAQLVARLEHIHIIPLYDYWREPDKAYLVMRWLEINLRKTASESSLGQSQIKRSWTQYVK